MGYGYRILRFHGINLVLVMKTWFQLIKELHGYEPKDKHTTTIGEMERLYKHFGMADMTYTDLQNLRDMFMLYYLTPGNKKEGWFSFEAMQSITAVIDYYKIKKGGQV